MVQRKKQRTVLKLDMFDGLPDDLVVSILTKLSASASCPADFVAILITCKRLNRLGLEPLVLSRAPPAMLAVRAKNWTDSAHRFIYNCVKAGNIEACYTLGMIRFYCLKNRGSGASLMAKAAIKSHGPALYSLAVIQFNGSGGSKTDKNLHAGVALCARAASLGHVDALRELGHCLQDGYGIPRNTTEGRRLLIQANARELASSLGKMLELHGPLRQQSMLLSDYGFNLPTPKVHPVNRFLKEWFDLGIQVVATDELRLCSHDGCGRPETRPHEYRRCAVCGSVNYCSRGCQALDWKLRHKIDCVSILEIHADRVVEQLHD